MVMYGTPADLFAGNLGAGKRYVMMKAVTRAITHGIAVERNEFGMMFTAPEGMSQETMMDILYR